MAGNRCSLVYRLAISHSLQKCLIADINTEQNTEQMKINHCTKLSSSKSITKSQPGKLPSQNRKSCLEEVYALFQSQTLNYTTNPKAAPPARTAIVINSGFKFGPALSQKSSHLSLTSSLKFSALSKTLSWSLWLSSASQ